MQNPNARVLSNPRFLKIQNRINLLGISLQKHKNKTISFVNGGLLSTLISLFVYQKFMFKHKPNSKLFLRFFHPKK